YYKWCKSNNFDSMLEKDIKVRQAKAQAKEDGILVQKQSQLDGHLRVCVVVVKYSDKHFKQAAIKWMIATDQPLRALEHPKFKEMIDVAASATAGV
ncbi:hypothetical protein CONPUDRAFT_42418, partial [Coniophora puteana RWD-64-598 SS2]